MTDDVFTCPLCNLRNDRIKGIYRHLLSAHRKSSLASALLESKAQDVVGIEPGIEVIRDRRTRTLSND
jgi:hypothetical protein